MFYLKFLPHIFLRLIQKYRKMVSLYLSLEIKKCIMKIIYIYFFFQYVKVYRYRKLSKAIGVNNEIVGNNGTQEGWYCGCARVLPVEVEWCNSNVANNSRVLFQSGRAAIIEVG